jgi:hypothetical protein
MTTTMFMMLAGDAVAVTGCTRDVSLLPSRSPGDAADGFPGPDAQADSGPDSSADARGEPLQDGGGGPSCASGGGLITLPTSSGPVCASALAARAHRFALCTCASLGQIAPLRTDVMDSTLGTVGGEASAAIGVNGSLQVVGASLTAAGAIHVAGPDGLTTDTTLNAARSLRVAGPTRITAGAAEVGTDAFFSGDISGLFAVTGAVHLAPGASSVQAIVAAREVVREAVSVPPPCNCGSGFVDVPRAITDTMAVNDNQTIGLAVDALANVTSSVARDIPCGAFALSTIDAQQAVLLKVRGRTLLAVAGDVTLRGGLAVELDSGAELDLLIGGKLTASGGNFIGSVLPARFRIWLASGGEMRLDDRPRIGAMIHAPAAAWVAPMGLDLAGALLASNVLSGAINIHYDQAVLSSGVSCGEPIETTVQ